MSQQIAKRVKQIVGEYLDVSEDRITPGARLVEDLGADSLSLVSLTLALETELEVDIADEDTHAIRTVQDAVDYVEKTRRRQPAAPQHGDETS